MGVGKPNLPNDSSGESAGSVKDLGESPNTRIGQETHREGGLESETILILGEKTSKQRNPLGTDIDPNETAEDLLR